MAMKFSGIGDNLVQAGGAAYMVPIQYRQNLTEGMNSPEALGRAASAGFWTASLSLWGGAVLSILPAATKQVISFAQQSSINTRARSMPFSARYEHSDAVSAMQSYSLSRMSDLTGFGNEASLFAGRYGRG